MIYKSISAKFLIRKLFSEVPTLGAENIPDIIEWMGEALELIGLEGQTEEKTVKVTTENHRGELPCDLYLIDAVGYNGYPLPYGYGSFRHTVTGRANIRPVNATAEPETYKIELDYIKTSEESIDVYINYQAYKTDHEGYPMIPDAVEVRNAVVAYVVMMLIKRGMKHPVLTYSMAKQEWDMAESKAYAKISIPDKPRMEAFMNRMVRLVPHIHPETQFGSQLSEPENIIL